MDFNTIKEQIKKFTSMIIPFLKEVIKLPYFKTYFFVSILAIIFFTIITFPFEPLLLGKIKNLERTTSIKNITMEDLNISLLGSSSVHNVKFQLDNSTNVLIRDIEINISLNPITLYFNKIIDGEIKISSLVISDSVTNKKYSMNLNLNIKTQFDKTFSSPKKGELQIFLKNIFLKVGEVTLPASMGSIPIEIPDIKIPSSIIRLKISGNKILVENFKITGADLSGEIKGSISMSKSIKNFRLNTIAIVDANSKILSNYKELISSSIDSKNKINIVLKGTFERPRALIKK